MSRYRNPAELLGLGRDAKWMRCLRAAGTDEAVMAGRASDYEAFSALAAAMPLYRGHPLADEVNGTLSAETGVPAPLCPHTVRVHWDAWVALHWYGRNPSGGLVPPLICPHCRAVVPTRLRREEVAVSPDPCRLTEPTNDLAAWSARVCASIPTDGRRLLIHLPPDYRFTRPDPYHAGLAVRAVAAHTADAQTATEAERHLLYTQALRVLGGALRETDGQIVLCGGTADEVLRLVRYLSDAKCLPRLVWLSDDPMAIAEVSGMDSRVETGLRLPRDADKETAERMLDAYATVAPIGRALVWGD